MRPTISCVAMLACCTPWDPHGLGYPDEVEPIVLDSEGDESEGSSSSGAWQPHDKLPAPADDDSSTGDESTSTGGPDTGSTSSSSGSSSTGDDEPSSPPYSGCDDPRCGLSPLDTCFVSGDQWCSWACETVADCGEAPDGVTVVCVPVGDDRNGCRLACEGDEDCLAGQLCSLVNSLQVCVAA